MPDRSRRLLIRSSRWVSVLEESPGSAVNLVKRLPAPVARLPYVPGLDGLRAIAVIAVVLYHAEFTWIPGGFLGVEVFFVISGYLITSLLLAEWQQRGELDLRLFWLRRARRLLPALFLLILSALAFAVLYLPGEVASLRRDAMAAAGYATNWYLVFGQKSYFETMGRPSLLLHLWSLAVEEQFYMLWPLLFIAGMRLFRRRCLTFVVLAGAVASTILMAKLYEPAADPSRLYYGTDTRATGLLIGSALAFIWAPGQVRRRLGLAGALIVDVVGLAALAVLVFLYLRLDEFQPFLYQGGFASVGVAGAVLIAVAVHPDAHIGRLLLGLSPLRWIGLRSYGIYLWHWPVFMVTRPQLDVPVEGLPLLAMRLAITAVLVEASFRFVETPIRMGALGRMWQAMNGVGTRQGRRPGLRWAAAATTVLSGTVVLGVSVASARPSTSPPYYAMTAMQTTAVVSSPRLTSIYADPVSSLVFSTGIEPAAVLRSDSVDVEYEPAERTSSSTASADSIIDEAQVSPSSESTLEEREPAAETAPPLIRVPGIRVTAIGDSVLLSALEELGRAVDDLDADAAIGRHAAAVIDLLEQRRDAHRLGEAVVIHIGNNGVFSGKQIDDIMEVLADVQKVVFVNVKVPRRWEGANNDVIADKVSDYPNAVLVDWHAASEKRPALFWDDGIHLRPEGARVYVNLIAERILAP